MGRGECSEEEGEESYLRKSRPVERPKDGLNLLLCSLLPSHRYGPSILAGIYRALLLF